MLKKMLFLTLAVIGLMKASPCSGQKCKTFDTLKKQALFLKEGHAGVDVFSDTDFNVIKVTNLNKSGEGSLAWAIAQPGPRIVVFEVGGVIDLEQSVLRIREPYLFVAGQTAPAPGITIIKGGINVYGHDVIIQHVSVRPGDCGLAPRSGWEVDGLSTFTYNVVIDHCSFTWSTDENLSASGPRHEGADKTSNNVTFSNCIISEALHESTHEKVYHSCGTLIHDYCRNIAITGNLYSHNGGRNPLLKPNAAVYVVNNLIYNPIGEAIYASWPVPEYEKFPDSLRHANLTAIGNVMIPGNGTKKDLYMIYGKMSVYRADNVIKRNIDDRQGFMTEYLLSPETEEVKTPFINTNLYKVLPSGKVPDRVLDNAGSRPKMRDAVDRRIVDDVKKGSGKMINSQEEVGGYPQHEMTRRQLSIPAKHIEKWLQKLSDELVYK